MHVRKVYAVGALVILGGIACLVVTKNAQVSSAMAPASDAAKLAGFAKALEKEIPIASRRAASHELTSENLAAIEAHIDSVVREKGNPHVADRLHPTTDVGRRLARIVMGTGAAKQLPREELKQLEHAYFDGFVAASDQTLAEGRSAIEHLSGPEFALERMGVFAVLNSLPGEASEVKALAMNELTSEVPPARPNLDQAGNDPALKAQALSWGPAQLAPLYAYKTYLNAVGNDPDQAMGGTIQAIESQQDSGLRTAIASGYLALYPDMKTQLYQRLSQTQVQLPDITPQPPSPGRISVPPVVAQD